MMHIDLKPGELLRIGEAIVRIDQKSGQTIRLSIDADKSVPIKRLPLGAAATAVDSAKNGISRNVD
ncbi:MAG: carbon storage regulator [Agitococcus sp.]|nr:carbon storage regulator [Agitococcus sp.]